MAGPMHDLRLPDALRDALARPWGPVVQTPELVGAVAGRRVAAIGDVVALTCLDQGIVPAFIVCDFRTQRGGEDPIYRARLGSWGDRRLEVSNPPATLTAAAWDAIDSAAASPSRTLILVDGEEDLLGLPAFAEMAPGDVVLYGMPGQGIVVVEVTVDIKQRVAEMVAGMTPA